MSDDTEIPAVRAPEGIAETVAAHLRPQPAIPAVIVFLLTLFVPVLAYDPAIADRSLWVLLIPVGIAASCALAAAAGFCSFFPHLAWIAIAAWALKFAGGPLPAYNRYVLFAGMFVTAVMVGVQGWRVRTGRFQPTIRIDSDEPDR